MAKPTARRQDGAFQIHALITGPPGVGKTTLVKRVVQQLRELGILLIGFYTEEVRGHHGRTGFDVVTLDGQRAPLARVSQAQQPGGSRKAYYVGKYEVKLNSFEQLALPSLQRPHDSSDISKKCVHVIDEIGKMELFSKDFVQLVQSTFQSPNNIVMATIPISKGKSHWLLEELRNRKDVQIFEVSVDNRSELISQVLSYIQNSLSALYD